MTLRRVPVLLLVLVAVSFAQDQSRDTNFPVGPQYLVTSSNPMSLRSIATPSLSLGEQSLAGTSDVPVATEAPAFAPPGVIVYLNNVYWGEHPPSLIFERRLNTPSMTADQTAWYMNAVESGLPGTAAPFPGTFEVAALESPQVPAESVIELTGGPIPTNLPSSIFDPGVTGTTDPQLLRQQRGYGVSLGEVAGYWKTHKAPAPRVFTNQDLRH